MNEKLIEAIPNFSEGQNLATIEYICSSIESVEGAKVLNCDIGKDANRTVITFVATVSSIEQAAFNAIKAAAEKIDMRQQVGEHPRIGATDVMPFVPLKGVTIEECIDAARAVGKRVAQELKIPIYCYEKAAFAEHKQNLAMCRKGEYEGIEQKFQNPLWYPDFGEPIYNEYVAKSGVTVIGARNFLLAVNFNLNCKDVEIADKIAKTVRYSGCKIEGERVHGTLKGAKAIGWYMEQYGFSQVSMNIVDMELTPLHIAFEEVKRVAKLCGVEVTGTEIIGMLPENVIWQAAEFYAPDNTFSSIEKCEFVAEKMNFSQIQQFDAIKKIIYFSNL
ncbi:MAG: glutamate formimidoyltransferase [Rikenellaceae bacterium]